MLIILLAFTNLTWGSEVLEKKEWFSEMNKEYFPLELTEPRCKKKEKGTDNQLQDLRCEIFKFKFN